MRLLLVEDDQQLATALRAALGQAGYTIDLATNGVDAEYMGVEQHYDVVVLDLGLPGRPGLQVLAAWRSRGLRMPVLVLTARDGWQERVAGLQAGADDYLGKPFHTEEVLARLQALVRRSSAQSAPRLCIEGLCIDEAGQQATLDSRAIELTATEFRLLRYLMRHAGEVVSKQRLYETLYEWDSERDINIIEVYIRRLRDKLGAGRIETRRGQGYSLRVGR